MTSVPFGDTQAGVLLRSSLEGPFVQPLRGFECNTSCIHAADANFFSALFDPTRLQTYTNDYKHLTFGRIRTGALLLPHQKKL